MRVQNIVFIIVLLLCSTLASASLFTIESPPPQVFGTNSTLNVYNVSSNWFCLNNTCINSWNMSLNITAVNGSYVPYVGAIDNVDLGVYNLTSMMIISKGVNLNPDISLGYGNARLTTSAGTSGRAIFEYDNGLGSNSIWQIDNGGNGLRFFNNSMVFVRINQTGLYEGVDRVCTSSNGVCSTNGGNESWNESYARTIFALIGEGGNSSFNQSLTDTLYSPIGSEGNTSWNQSLANTLYLSINATTGNSSWNQSLAVTLFASILEPIASSLGNWSLDKVSYATLTLTTSLQDQISSIGNWTNDKSNYVTIVNFDNNLTNIYMNDSLLLSNILSLGNWTLDKPNYAQLAQLTPDIINANVNMVYINESYPQQTNFTKTCLNDDCTVYHEIKMVGKKVYVGVWG